MTRADDWAEWERRRQERVRPYLDRLHGYVSTRFPELRERPTNRRERFVEAVLAIAYLPALVAMGIWFGFTSPLGLAVGTVLAVLFMVIYVKVRRWARRTG